MLKKDVNPNVVSYTTLVRGYCMKHEVDKALAVFHELVATRGMKPNAVTFNTLIKGLSEAGRFDEIKEVLRTGSFAPDACTLNVLIKAHCDGGDIDAALEVFREMPRPESPDSASYSVLIRALCLSREFERAERMFEELYEKELLLEKDGSKPLAAAYNPMFEYLCANGKTKQAERVFRQLMKIGAQDPPSYRTLITGHCREGGFKSGYELLVLMLRREFVPDSAHRLVLFCLENNQTVDISRWNRVIEGLCKHKRHSEAFGLYNELVEIGKNHQENSCIVVLRNALEAAGILEEVRFLSKRMAMSQMIATD